MLAGGQIWIKCNIEKLKCLGLGLGNQMESFLIIKSEQNVIELNWDAVNRGTTYDRGQWEQLAGKQVNSYVFAEWGSFLNWLYVCMYVSGYMCVCVYLVIHCFI